MSERGYSSPDSGPAASPTPPTQQQPAAPGLTRRRGRPLAVVGSQVSYEEEMFGAAFDGVVVRRFWQFISPYRKLVTIAVAAVLLFTVTQVLTPLLLRMAIDDAVGLSVPDRSLLLQIARVFFIVVVINYVANVVQEMIVGRVSGHLLFDLRRAMYAHLQQVSLSFMDKTEVGRLMSRLQGDVNALQEFLETSIFAIGDLVLLLGIVTVLLWLDPWLGLLTLGVVPALFAVRIVWLPRARKVFLHARVTSSSVNGALAENVHGIRAIQGMAREDVNYRLFGEIANENLRAHTRASRYSNMMIPIVDALTGLAMGIVVLVGGRMVLGGDLDLGVVVAFLFYVQRFFDPIRSLTIQYSIMQR
ncbi:MAG: ABC transporter ATP-binding protein, partial [Gammaproteobacteria bacterium]|nr:ABC transporter ATP-binding protein [Gammaproteobacteria bacterium]